MIGYQTIRIEADDRIKVRSDAVEIGPIGRDVVLSGAGADLVRLADAVLEAAATAYRLGEGDPSGVALASIEDARRALSGGAL